MLGIYEATNSNIVGQGLAPAEKAERASPFPTLSKLFYIAKKPSLNKGKGDRIAVEEVFNRQAFYANVLRNTPIVNKMPTKSKEQITMKIKRKKSNLIIAAVVAVLIITVLSRLMGTNLIVGFVRMVAAPIQTGFSYIADKAMDTVDFIYEMKGYKTENERLVAENLTLKKTVKDTEHYRAEIEELRSVLNLKNSISEYNTVAASVIGYSTDTFFDKIEINRGTFSGISEGDVVINAEGLVGRVSEVGPNHAIVSTIIAEENSIGITISRTGDIGIVEGDSVLCQKAQCKLTFVDKDVKIMEGDLLETSGSGSIYPGGINLGIIRSINMDNLGMLNYAVVDTAVDFENLHEVLVLDSAA